MSGRRTAAPRQAAPRRAPSREPRPRAGRLDRPEIEAVLVTVEEAAKMLAVGRTVCYGLIRRGELRSVVIGRARRVPKAAVQEFVEYRMAQAS